MKWVAVVSCCSALLVASLGSGAVAQASRVPGSPVHRTSTSRKYCQDNGGFCFRYPAAWSLLGEIYNGQGVVVAPSQKLDRSLWNELTVAMIVAPPAGDEPPTTVDVAIESAMTGLREGGQNPETLQRQMRILDGKPAQMLKVRYHDRATDRDWVEELVFIEGPEQEIYSVALKSSPADVAKLQPAFENVLQSWTLPQPPPPPSPSSPPSPGRPEAPRDSVPAAPPASPPHPRD